MPVSGSQLLLCVAVSILQTVLLYVGVPLAIYLVIALLSARKGLTRKTRYRPGEQWNYPPVWWTANPTGAALPETAEHVQVGTERGGAHGDW